MDRKLVASLALLAWSLGSSALPSASSPVRISHATQKRLLENPSEKLCADMRFASSSPVCLSGRLAFDTFYSDFNQYAGFSTVDFSNEIAGGGGVRFTGYWDMFVDVAFPIGVMHAGFIYYPAEDRGSYVDSHNPTDYKRQMSLFVDEAYLDLVPVRDYPLLIRAGKSYTPFASTAISYAHSGDHHPVYAPTTLLLTETRANVLSINYDDYENTGLSAVFYLQSHHNTINDTSGRMEAWGFGLGYQTPYDRLDQFAWGFNLGAVSTPEAVAFLTNHTFAVSDPSYSGLLFLTVKRLTLQYASVMLKDDTEKTVRAWDFDMTYHLRTVPEAGEANIFFGWGNTRQGNRFNLPASAWWIGVKQDVEPSLELALMLIRSHAYESSSVAPDREDNKYVFRVARLF